MIPARNDIAALPGGADALARRDLDALAAIVPARQVRRLVPIADIQARLHSSGAWWAIKRAIASGTAADDTRAAAQTVVDMASARYDNVDMSIPLVAATFAALVQVDLMSQATFDEIVAMSWRAVPYDRRDFEPLFNEGAA